MLRGKQEILNALDRYIGNLHSNRDALPVEVRTSLREAIYDTDSIDTGRFIRAVDFFENVIPEGYRFLIGAMRDADVIYDGFLEFDGITRNWVGRFNYEKAIENSDFEPFFDSLANQSFII